MRYLIMASVLLLSGCRSGMYEAKAEFLCKDLGGVYHVYLWSNPAPYAICNDGSRAELTGVIITDPKYFAKDTD